MGASAGDLLARDLAAEWLRRAGHDCDIALAPPFAGGVDWHEVEPANYGDVVFVCGPVGNGPPLAAFLDRFAGCRLTGLNTTMLHELEDWNPFEILFERDSDARARPDIALVAREPLVPVVGTVLVHRQREYPGNLHQAANDALQRLAASRDVAAVPIDTRLDVNQTGLRSTAQVESLIARMDVVLTSRLHGMVLAIKNGVPAVVIDPVAGGRKVLRQAQVLDWPIVFTADAVTDRQLQEAFDFCLTDEARAQARRCRDEAVSRVIAARDEFIEALSRQFVRR
jgi:hypothetical protein